MSDTPSAHTPGPWEATMREWGGDDHWFIQFEEGEKTVAAMNTPCLMYNNAEADARLIAAAPELLAAAKSIFELLQTGALVRDTRGDIHSDWAIKAVPTIRAIANLNLAISKAEGKS